MQRHGKQEESRVAALLEVATNLLKQGIAPEQVMAVTGLARDQVEALIKPDP